MYKISTMNPETTFSFFDSQCKFNLNIIHQNIQCLANKILNLDNVLVDEYNCDFLLLTEHWQNKDQLNAVKLCNFTLLDCFCRNVQKNGGVAVYKNKQFASDITVHSISDFCQEGILGCCCVELIYHKIISVVM